MKHIVELENNDDMASIRGRINVALSSTTANGQEKSRLLLLVPRQNRALQSLVNMKLLARIAQTRAVDIALVSNQPAVRDYAREVGIKAFGTLNGAKRKGWVPPEAVVTPPAETTPPAIVEAKEKQPAPKPPPKPKKKYKVVEGSGRVGFLQQFGALLALIILAPILVLAAFTLLPEATVTMTPVAREVETEMVVRADPNVDRVDFDTLTFPARPAQVELDLLGQIETVETDLAPVGLATGPVTFINRTEEFQIIPISTTVTTSAGEPVQFFTVQTATIPAGIGATTSTLVIAAEPGPRGNVRPGQINRFDDPFYSLLARVVNEGELAGGTMEAAKIVVEADKERLREHLQELVRQEGLARLEASLAEQEFIPADSLQVIVLDLSYGEFSGDFSDRFTGEMQAVVRGTVVGGYNANRLALAALQAQVPPGYALDVEGLQFGAGEVIEVAEQVVTFRIFANGRAVPEINAEDVAEDVAWLSVGEAQSLLAQQYDLATVPGVELSPDWLVEWLGRLPYLPLRIDVQVNDAVTFVAEGE